MTTRNEDCSELEQMIDRHGLYAVVQMLETICQEKSDHLLSNWQDQPAANRWLRAANKCDKLHSELVKIQLP
jgi:alpha-amylase/alpha-mannosidase (GH57 family)